ncbi:MAG: DUF1413 domain-containing protein [Candidatus Thiodiazotropha sp.]
MDDILKSIKAYLYDRSTSPLIGAFITAWSIWNYRFYLVIFAGKERSVDEIFSQIDILFPAIRFSIFSSPFSINGELFHGFIVPCLITLSYIYLYPRLAKPVYEHSLKQQIKLREIKQKEENNRLLSVEESRQIYRRISDLQAEHSEEIDRYNAQISSLREIIKELEGNNPSGSEKTTPDGADISLKSEDLKPEDYDHHLRKLIEELPSGDFQLSDLFRDSDWESMSTKNKQAIGKRLKSMIDRGDFVGVNSAGKGTENQQIYHKTKSELSASEELALKEFIGLESDQGVTVKDIQQAVGGHIEATRVILHDLVDRSYIEYFGETNDGQQLYQLKAKGRKYLVENDLLPQDEKA